MAPCQLMTEKDNSWFQEDDSWRKTTTHVEMAAWQQVFCSVLSPQHSLLIF